VFCLAVFLLVEGLYDSESEFFDVVIEAYLLPMGQKFQGLDLLKNRLKKGYLLSLEISFFISTLTLRRLGSQRRQLRRG
jgi:hypothetical protein